MVQVGAPYDYHEPVDENADPSWTQVIKDAVREFVGAVAESSNQLASAAEKFAADSMHTIDEAAARAERSASSSTDMAQIAQKAAEDARLAADSLQSAVNEASERIRSEAGEGAAIHLTQVQEAGERLRTDLQGHVDDMISRMAAAAGTSEDAVAAAEAATTAAREAADRVQQSVNAVEAAVANAQRAADEARVAAERSEASAGSMSDAVSAAQEAAEASRQSAEQASTQSTVIGGEANMLLERLETDYDMLTRLVRELHGRIASLSLPTVPSTEAPPRQEMTPDIEPTDDVPVAFESTSDNGTAVPEASEEVEPSYWAHVDDTVWETPAAEAGTEPEAVVESIAEAKAEAVVEPVVEADPEPASPLHVDDEDTVGEILTAEPEDIAEAIVENEPEPASQSELDDRNAILEAAVGESAIEPNASAENLVETESEPATITEPVVEAESESSHGAYLNDEDAAWEALTAEAMTELEAVAESVGEKPESSEAVVEVEPEPGYWAHLNDESAEWDTPGSEREVISEPEDSEPVVEQASYSEIPTHPIEEIRSPTYESPQSETTEQAALQEAPGDESTSFEMPVPMAHETSLEPASEPELEIVPEAPAPVEVSVSGRVQVRISPVPDFDRLLNLDGALGRVSGVDSVTLADYAQEEVTFRVEVLGEKDAGLFTREIAVAAGVEATLVDAADNGLVIRIK